MRRNWNAIGCIVAVPVKINEQWNVVADGREPGCDMHFGLRDSAENGSDELSEGFCLLVACNCWCDQRAPLQSRKEESSISFLFYSPVSFRFNVNVSGNLATCLLGHVYDRLEIIGTG
jgi:hypothetical protein